MATIQQKDLSQAPGNQQNNEARDTVTTSKNLVDLLAMPYVQDIDFDPPMMRGLKIRDVDLY